jgi:hypothetical protein
VVGLFVLTIVSVVSSGANPIAKAHSLSAVRLNSLFTGNDPLAPRYLLLDDAVREYASMAGRFASPAQMAQDGFLPFVLSSAYAPRPMRSNCNSPSPGDYCFSLHSPYDIASFKVFDPSGSPISNVFMESVTIDPADRDRPRTLAYQAATELGLSDTDRQLVFTGQLLGGRLLQVIAAGSSIASAVSDAFSAEPYNQLKDPAGPDLLAFNGSGFGNRIHLTTVRGGLRIRMQISGSTGTVYEADFGNLSEAGDTGAFRILRSPLTPGMTPTEDLPAVFPWQDGGAEACGSSTPVASAPPAIQLAQSFRSIFSARPAFATGCLNFCIFEDCCMPEGESNCTMCGKTTCCTVSPATGCNCPAGQCCLFFQCGNGVSYTKCYGGG